MEELSGRMLACQIMIAALATRMANEAADPLRFITDYRDEVLAVINGIRIEGLSDMSRVRSAARGAADELFALMKPPSADVGD